MNDICPCCNPLLLLEEELTDALGSALAVLGSPDLDGWDGAPVLTEIRDGIQALLDKLGTLLA